MNKYLRTIHETGNSDLDIAVRADVYEVLEGFNVTCPARQHAAKKILCSGIRGKGDAVQDLTEARDALNRAIELELRRVKIEERNKDLAGTVVPSDAVVSGVAVGTEDIEAEFHAAPGRGNPSAVRGGQRKGAGTGATTRKR